MEEKETKKFIENWIERIRDEVKTHQDFTAKLEKNSTIKIELLEIFKFCA